MNKTDYKCEICGAPATNYVRDIKRRNNYKTGIVERKPYGPPHYFCNEHDRVSKEVDMTVSPLHSLLFGDDDEW